MDISDHQVITNWHALGQQFNWQNHQVFYRIMGSGPCMIMLHGFPTAGIDWQNCAKVLQQHFTLIIPDLLDYGYSRNLSGKRASIHDQVDMLDDLLIHLSVGNIHILAHDMGDTVAQELLAREQEQSINRQIDSCIFLNGGLLPSAHRPRFAQKLLLSPIGFIIAEIMPAAKFMMAVKEVFGDVKPSDEDLQYLWTIALGINGRASFARRIHYMKDRLQHQARWQDALCRARQPLLLINGVDDPVSGEHAAKALQDIVPEVHIERLAGIGHFPLLEAPERVVAAVLAHHGLS